MLRSASSSSRMANLQCLQNARYAKLRWQVRKIYFYGLKVWNWLCQCGNANIIGKGQDLSLPVWGVEKIHEIFHAYLRFGKGCAELPLGTKIFLVFRVVRDISNLPQGPTDCHNNVASLGYGARKRTGFFLCHKLRNVVRNAKASKICAVNYWKSCRCETFHFQIRSKWAGCNVRDIVTKSDFRQSYTRRIFSHENSF